MLYFAYGMNTNLDSMRDRCPRAQSLGPARLIDHLFRFAVHADVVRCRGSYVDGVLWEISQQCQDSLDILEGYPWYYDRRYRPVWFQGRTVMAMTYHMQPHNLESAPSRDYFELVETGYRQHGVPVDQLHNALELASNTIY